MVDVFSDTEEVVEYDKGWIPYYLLFRGTDGALVYVEVWNLEWGCKFWLVGERLL